MFSLPFVVASYWTEVTKICSVLYHCFHPLTWSISTVTLHSNWIPEIKSEISCFPISLLLVMSKSGGSCCCYPPLKSPEEDDEEIQEATGRADVRETSKEWSTGSCFRAGWHVHVKREQRTVLKAFLLEKMFMLYSRLALARALLNTLAHFRAKIAVKNLVGPFKCH